jgi:hypothetical protein
MGVFWVLAAADAPPVMGRNAWKRNCGLSAPAAPGPTRKFPCDPPDSACSPPGRVAAVWPALPGSGFHPMRNDPGGPTPRA